MIAIRRISGMLGAITSVAKLSTGAVKRMGSQKHEQPLW